MPPPKDPRWPSIVQYVPSDVLIELARQKPGHSPQKLYEDQESRVDEVFRVCDEATIQTLYEEFPRLHNSNTWFYRPTGSVTKGQIEAALGKPATAALLTGITPEIPTEEPQLYKIEQLPKSVLFRYVAGDRKQHLAVDFGETKAVELLSYYDVVLHFSEITVLVFGPTSNVRADKVIGELDSFLGINGSWLVLKPGKGAARTFYRAIKKSIGGLLIETKRHDPRGNYKTIALQARDRQPDLEDVPDFKGSYYDADSYYDVLQYKSRNKLDFAETAHVSLEAHLADLHLDLARARPRFCISKIKSVNYYGNPRLDNLKKIIDAEVRDGIHNLRASYISRKFQVDPAVVQQVLSDLAAAGDLKTHYQVLCSGENQHYDVDREFEDRREVPNYEITCRQCGDHYVPSEENILLSFEPTEDYLEALASKS